MTTEWNPQTRLSELADALAKVPVVANDGSLCLFAVGSYGRQEASPYSDLDLFIMHVAGPHVGPDPAVKTEVMRVAETLKFPEFTRDGEYLAPHRLNDVIANIGSESDDFKNHFTARLLLLLESKPVWNEELYVQCITEIVKSYYRDFHDHHKEFRPVFLINDIIRYWRTLCLNYEHRRDRRKEGAEGQAAKVRSHLKNLKLGFPRLLTCYSAVALIASRDNVVTADDVIRIFRMTPRERLEAVAKDKPAAARSVKAALKEYDWFLERVSQPTDQVNAWMADEARRAEAFLHAKRFKEHVYHILRDAVTREDVFRVLVV